MIVYYCKAIMTILSAFHIEAESLTIMHTFLHNLPVPENPDQVLTIPKL